MQGKYSKLDAAIILVHGFGGGTFSWRHLMRPLADGASLPVIAFDRPAFGANTFLVIGPVDNDEQR